MSMNTQHRTWIATAIALLVLVAATTSFAGNRAGTVSGQFLKIPTSARAIGMGGTGVALAEGVNSIAYNPSGILSVENLGVGMTYTAWFADIQHSYVGAVKTIPGLGSIGVGLVLLTTDDMIETTPQFPEGTGRTFKSTEYALNIAYARQVTDQFRVGVTGKIIKSYLFNTELGASTFAFDIGTLYDIPILKTRIGVSLTNIGKDVQYIEEVYSLPTALRFGVLVDVLKDGQNALVTALQVNRVNDSEEQYNVGAEYQFNNMLFLRGGYKFAYDQEDITAGFGLKTQAIGFNGQLDYGYNNFKYLPGTHSFTLEVQF
jgi:hypothetical protein